MWLLDTVCGWSDIVKKRSDSMVLEYISFLERSAQNYLLMLREIIKHDQSFGVTTYIQAQGNQLMNYSKRSPGSHLR